MWFVGGRNSGNVDEKGDEPYEKEFYRCTYYKDMKFKNKYVLHKTEVERRKLDKNYVFGLTCGILRLV